MSIYIYYIFIIILLYIIFIIIIILLYSIMDRFHLRKSENSTFLLKYSCTSIFCKQDCPILRSGAMFKYYGGKY